MAFLKAVCLSMVLTVLCPVLASAGPGGRGGGGPQAADFITSARIIESSLKRSPKDADAYFGIPQLTDLYSGAVATTDVICATGSILASMRQQKQKAFYDGGDTIHLDCENYGDLNKAGGSKYVVVFHEYMRKIGVETSDYRVSSRLPLFVFPATGKRAIDAFCAGGSKDKFQLENYLAQMIQEKSIDSENTAKMLREAANGGIKFPDAAARQIATYLGWNKDNQYPWAVEIVCMDKDRSNINVDFNDTSHNNESTIALNGGSDAYVQINKSITIIRGRAASTLQNGFVPRTGNIDQYQPYCTFAHDTDLRNNDIFGSGLKVKVASISAVVVSATPGSAPTGFSVNFSIADEKKVTDIQVWMPGDVGSIERLRSVLNSCGVRLNLQTVVLPAILTN